MRFFNWWVRSSIIGCVLQHSFRMLLPSYSGTSEQRTLGGSISEAPPLTVPTSISDSTSYSDSSILKQNCQAERNSALLSCFLAISGNGDELLDVANISYSDACIYSMLKANSSHVKRMVEALSADAKLLSDHGSVPMPLQIPSVIPGSIPIPSPNACHTATSTDVSNVTSDVTSDAAITTSPSPARSAIPTSKPHETFPTTNAPVLVISGAKSLPLPTIYLLLIGLVTHKAIYIP